MSNQNDINTFEKMNNMKNMLGNSFIEFLKPNIKKKENESVFKMLEMVKDKPEAYLELLAVAIFHQNFDIIKHMVENFKIVETDAPYMKASSFYNSILPDDSKDKINDSKDYIDVHVPFVLMSGIGGDIEIFKYLLKNKLISDKNQCEVIGLSKKYKNSFSSNIIGACAYYGKKDLLDYLLRYYKNELNINIITTEKKAKNTKFSFAKEYSGCTPCLLAMIGTASDSQTLEILKILKNYGANFVVSDSNKDNLLHLATKNKKIKCAKYIVDELKLISLVNEVNKDKYNPLSLSQHLNNEDFISYFSEKENNKANEKEIEENIKFLIEDSANRSIKQSKKSKKNKKKGKYNKNEKEDKKDEENNEKQSIEVLRPQIIEDNDKEEEKKEEGNKKEEKENKEDEKEYESEEIKEKEQKEASKKANQKGKKAQKVEKSENVPKAEPVEIIGLTTKKSKKLKKFKASLKAKFNEGENKEESNKDKDKEKEENKKEDIKEEKEEKEEKEVNEPNIEEGEKKSEKQKKISKKEKRIDKNNEEIEKEKKRKEEEERKKREEEEEERKKREEEERQKKEWEEQRKREEEERKREEEERKRRREEKRRKEEERKRKEEERQRREEEERQKREEEERQRREEEERKRLEEEERKRREEEERKRLEEEERKRREEEEEKEISNSDDENIDENSSEKEEENDMDNIEITKKDYEELNHNYLELEKKLETLEKEKKELTSCLTKLYLENKENSKIYPSSNNEENINDLMYLANKEIEEKNHIINELEEKKAMLDLTNIQNFSNEKLKKYKEFYQKNLKIIDDALKKA